MSKLKAISCLRYELNDLITISPFRCECGSSFRVIEQVMGRTDDLFWAPRIDVGELQFIFPDFIRRAIISSSDEFEEYQAIQKSFEKVIVKLTLKTEADKGAISERVETNIHQVFRKYNCEIPNVEIIFEAKLKKDPSKKLIRIYREFDIT